MPYSIYILILIVLNSSVFAFPFDMSAHEYYSLNQKAKLKAWEQSSNIEPRLKYKEIEKKIRVVISKGDFRFMKQGYIIPAFELKKYEVKKVPVYNKKYNTLHHYIWVTYQDIGLYLGIKPHQQYKTLTKYNSQDVDFFNKVSYFNRAALIVKEPKWRSGSKQKVSFEGTYNAYNLDVSIYLKTKRVYYDF